MTLPKNFTSPSPGSSINAGKWGNFVVVAELFVN